MTIVLKSMLFLIAAPGTVLVLVPYLLLRSQYQLLALPLGALRWLGLLPALVGIALLLWSFWAFTFIGKGTPAPIDPPKFFVAEGLYRLVRNPMYVGVLLTLLGEVLVFQSTILLAYSFLVFLAFHLFVVYYEEPRLSERFGDSYLRYLGDVPRWLPGVPRTPAPDRASDQDR